MRAKEFIVESSIVHQDQDLQDVASWLGTTVDNLHFDVKYEPMSMFENQASEMLGTYNEFPEDAERTEIISSLISKGQGLLPIYIEKADPDLFILEGRHRVVAFLQAGFDKIPVAWVSVIDIEKQKPEYRMEL